MGIRIVVLDPTAGCPASAVAVQLVGSFRDPGAVKQIAQLVQPLFSSAPSQNLMHSLHLYASCPVLGSAYGRSFMTVSTFFQQNMLAT